MSAGRQMYAKLAKAGKTVRVVRDGWSIVRGETPQAPEPGESALDVVLRFRREGWNLVEDRSRGELRAALEDARA